ncbi:hypothetical protein RJT34_03330 [Clitoria ternatea]|uniref:non-specific serine/threonine protein kinase n=1 Tax=Clitoria ternatea TaxID=43366 RepID=A0AAN9KJL6_CLITE
MAALALLSTLLMIMILSLRASQGSSIACGDTCGSIQIKYPFGTGPGCGSPLFSQYITCTTNQQLILKTHTGSYPITSISYTTSTLTLTPQTMSTCTSIKPSPNNFGLDWTSPFQIGSSTFILLSCTQYQPQICDPSFHYICASIYTCPSIVNLGIPLFPPTNTCCVYSPANLDDKSELDLKAMKCGGYASVVSLGDNPTDPTHWVYGVNLKYSSYMALGNNNNLLTTKCSGCENSGGVCGFAPPGNGFVCVCKGGYNTSLDCSTSSYNQNQEYLFPDSASSPPRMFHFLFLSYMFFLILFWMHDLYAEVIVAAS